MKIIIIIFLLFLAVGCNKSTTNSTNSFYTMAKEVGPTFSSVSRRIHRDWYSGTLVGTFYETFQDCDASSSYGSPNYCSGNMANIYKVLWEAGQIYSDAESSCKAISEKNVLAPFDMGFSTPPLYNCAGNSGTMSDNYATGYAIKTEEQRKNGLLTYRWSPQQPEHLEHGILQGFTDESTGELEIHMLHQVIYATRSSGFVHRSNISGNSKTNSFILSFITASLPDASTYTQIVGKGVSKGSGNYFLFKVKTSNGIDGNYFCFPADADLSTLQTMHSDNPQGKTTVDTGCASYEDSVNQLTFLGPQDVPKALSDFTDSSILLSY